MYVGPINEDEMGGDVELMGKRRKYIRNVTCKI
jgi:hypothetical protein